MRPANRRVFAAVLITALFVISIPSVVTSAQSAVHVQSSSGPSTAARASGTMPASSNMLKTASASLARGGGPADGRPADCASDSPGTLTCGGPRPIHAPAHAASTPADSVRPTIGRAASARATTPAVRPAATTIVQWFNQSAYMNGLGFGGGNYTQFEAAAAYDPYQDMVIVFGGCSFTCPTSYTWGWNGESWENLTPSISPPAVYGQSMVWDPEYSAIIEVGGIMASGQLSNQTWELTDEVTGWFWTNITIFVGPLPGNTFYYNGTAFASIAYDDALHEVFLVDGCIVASCELVWSGTWILNDYAWSVYGLGPTGYLTSASYLYGASMAYDRASQELVYFGGITAGDTIENLTYVLPASNGTWTNITSTSSSCFLFTCGIYPEARFGASMTWDGQLDDIVLVGGESSTGLANDTWYFSDGLWYTSGLFGSIPEPNAVVWGSIPVNCSDIAPVLLGGLGVGYTFNNSWVLEAPPAPSFTVVSPSPADVAVEVEIETTNTLGDGSGPTYFMEVYDSEGNFDYGYWTANFSSTFNFTNYFEYSAGVWEISIFEFDYYGITATANFNLTVVPSPTVTVTPTPDVTELSGGSAPVTFTSLPAGGTQPYYYFWTFGDGSPVSTAANVSHTYTASGLFDGWLDLYDSGGGFYNSTFSILVFPQLTASADSNVTATDVGTPVTFTGTPGGGSGSYTTTAWSFGDGNTAATSTATHTYAHSGVYTAYFNVTDSLGYKVSSSVTVTVNPALTAAPTPTPGTVELGSAPASVSFTSGASGGTGPYTYLWNFGDSTPESTATAPSHTYTTAGTFHGYVVVTDSRGHFVNESFAVTVDPALGATVAGNVSTSEVGYLVKFTGTPSGGSGSYSTYAWQFGNGGPTTTGAGPVTHAFPAAGTYTVYYNVTDSLGYTATSKTSVTIDPALSASVAPNVTATDVGLSVQFTGRVSGGSGSYSTYSWQFGNGTTVVSGAGPLDRTFATAGKFEVYYNVTDSLGFTVSAEHLFYVNTALSGTASASSSTPHVGDTVTFTGAGLGGTPAYTYNWNFGDGSTPATTASATHSYSSTGNFTATLTIGDAAGGKFVKVLYVVVSSKPSTLLGGLSSGTGLYALIGVVLVILVAAVLGVLLMRRRRKPAPTPASGGPPQPWSESTTPPSTGGNPPISGNAPPPGAR